MHSSPKLDKRWHVLALEFVCENGCYTPVVANGMIYLNDTADGKLLALNEQTGALKWSDVYPGNGPSVANGVVYTTE